MGCGGRKFPTLIKGTVEESTVAFTPGVTGKREGKTMGKLRHF